MCIRIDIYIFIYILVCEDVHTHAMHIYTGELIQYVSVNTYKNQSARQLFLWTVTVSHCIVHDFLRLTRCVVASLSSGIDQPFRSIFFASHFGPPILVRVRTPFPSSCTRRCVIEACATIRRLAERPKGRKAMANPSHWK